MPGAEAGPRHPHPPTPNLVYPCKYPRRRGRFQSCPTNQTTNTPLPRRPAEPPTPTPLSHSERGASKRSYASGVCPGRKGHANQTTTIPSPHPVHPVHPCEFPHLDPLDFDATSVVQIKTSARADTSRTRRPETSPRRTGLGPQLFSMPQLPTYKQGSADGSPHGEPEATAQAGR